VLVWMLIAESRAGLVAHRTERCATLIARLEAGHSTAPTRYRTIVVEVVLIAAAPQTTVIANVAIVDVAAAIARASAIRTGVHLPTLHLIAIDRHKGQLDLCNYGRFERRGDSLRNPSVAIALW
jgi:hypothetical protein